MRIRVVRTPPLDEVDGISLDQFRPVGEYRLGHSLAALFLAEGWGEPVTDDETTGDTMSASYKIPLAADRRRRRRRA
jgi:hypothetical protein